MIDVVIVGGGIAGLATALALKKVGVKALVLERSSDLRTSGAALSLFNNAWIALDELGVSQKLYPSYAPLTKGYVTDIKSQTVQEMTFDTNSNRDKGGLRAIHRRALLEALAEELPQDSIRFSSKLKSIVQEQEQGTTIYVLELEDGTIIKAKVVIGCDGVHSVIARWLGLAMPVHSGRYGIRGLAFYPQGHGFNHEVRQFVDEGKRGGFVSLNDKELYWFLVFKSAGEGKEVPSDPESIQKEILENLAKDFPPTYLDVVKHANLSELTCAPLMLRYPWDLLLKTLRSGNVSVAGDAMHPTTPDLGQGGCMALEDAVVLGRHIGNSINQNGELIPRLIGPAIDGYVKERKWRAAFIITASFLSGWVQQNGSNWWMKFLRDVVFYKFLRSRAFDALEYDCGKLPCISNDTLHKTSNDKTE